MTRPMPADLKVILVSVLKGAAVFLSDLARHISLDCTFDFIAVASYAGSTRPQGTVRLIKDVDIPLTGVNVLLVEDILDTGRTLRYLRELLLARSPKTLRIVTLLEKPTRREAQIAADYVGFQIPDQFVVGYGMDYAERYRNLPDICVLPGSL
jgi:hypoxanthine phosphoribosyltransferase